MRAWRLFTFLLIPIILRPCECGDYLHRPACDTFFDTPAVFTGTVVSKSTTPERMAIYSVHIEEIFRGIPPHTKHVFLDSNTPCGSSFQLGTRYVFYAGRQHPPSTYLYAADYCTRTRQADHAVEDLAWLRANAKLPQRTRIYGTVIQNGDWRPERPLEETDTPVPHAQITLEGIGRAYSSQSGPNGSYHFEGIPPGRYRISAQQPPFTPSPWANLEVRPGGCARRLLRLKSEGKIEGRLLAHTGAPLAETHVQLVRLLPNGFIAERPTAASQTDTNGRFALDEVASGDFVIKIDSDPFPRTFFPGVPNRQQARPLHLAAHQHITGIRMRMPVPLPKRVVTVHVFWADGKPVTRGARAWASYEGDHRTGYVEAAASNQVRLTLLEGLHYQISADFIDFDSRPVLRRESKPVHLSAGRGPANLHIRLQWIEPSPRAGF